MLTEVDHERTMSESTRFRPAVPSGFVLWAVQTYLRLDLAWRNRLHLELCDLKTLRGLPRERVFILASNHADETDFKACLELSRRCNRRFLYHDESRGVRRRLRYRRLVAPAPGCFFRRTRRPERPGKTLRYRGLEAGDEEMLVIFPEGEIYYLNDLVQPFKSGVVDIGMQAVIESRRTQPDWTAYLVPMAIKYRYRQPIRPAPGAEDPIDGAASLSANPRLTRCRDDWLSLWRNSCIAKS